jgi:hypothetical protein
MRHILTIIFWGISYFTSLFAQTFDCAATTSVTSRDRITCITPANAASGECFSNSFLYLRPKN